MHASRDRTVLSDDDLHSVKDRAAVLRTARAGGADAAVVRAQSGAAATGDDEPRAVMDVVIEQQRVRAAHERDTVFTNEVEELTLADIEAPFRVRLEMSTEAGRTVHEHDTVRLGGGFQCPSEELQRRLPGSLGAVGVFTEISPTTPGAASMAMKRVWP